MEPTSHPAAPPREKTSHQNQKLPKKHTKNTTKNTKTTPKNGAHLTSHLQQLHLYLIYKMIIIHKIRKYSFLLSLALALSLGLPLSLALALALSLSFGWCGYKSCFLLKSCGIIYIPYCRVHIEGAYIKYSVGAVQNIVIGILSKNLHIYGKWDL